MSYRARPIVEFSEKIKKGIKENRYIGRHISLYWDDLKEEFIELKKENIKLKKELEKLHTKGE